MQQYTYGLIRGIQASYQFAIRNYKTEIQQGFQDSHLFHYFSELVSDMDRAYGLICG
ncbi:hypothetical protein ACWATR_32320 [Nostoc sp. UIC 10890]